MPLFLCRFIFLTLGKIKYKISSCEIGYLHKASKQMKNPSIR